MTTCLNYSIKHEKTVQRGNMSQVSVELVKYDTEKTKKRKRKNLLVSAKTEEAVIEKLEKIHKGDKVMSIYEIVWAEETEVKKEQSRKILRGVVKFYNEKEGFGFITPDSDAADLFFHSTALSGEVLYEDEVVDYEISIGPKGPIAIRIKLFEE